MKAITLTTVITIILITAYSLKAENKNAHSGQFDVKLSEEAYVDDVPFDTEKIVSELEGEEKSEKQQKDVQLQEEEYVDDLNFNTRQVIINHFHDIWMKTKILTKAIGKEINSYNNKGIIQQNQINLFKLYETLLKKDKFDVKLQEEPYVDDIPFNTEEVVNIK